MEHIFECLSIDTGDEARVLSMVDRCGGLRAACNVITPVESSMIPIEAQTPEEIGDHLNARIILNNPLFERNDIGVDDYVSIYDIDNNIATMRLFAYAPLDCSNLAVKALYLKQKDYSLYGKDKRAVTDVECMRVKFTFPTLKQHFLSYTESINSLHLEQKRLEIKLDW